MPVSGVSCRTYHYSLDTVQKNVKYFRENFQLMGQALQSEDLTGARNAFSALQQLLPYSSQTRIQTGSQGESPNALADGFASLGEALQSGDLAKAADIYATLRADRQTAARPSQNDTTTAATLSATAGGSGSSSGLVDVTA